MKKHIPNALTGLNLLCGTFGVVYVVEKSTLGLDFNKAAYFVWIACVFDFLDGFAARALKVSSPIGKELDSLADLISFGLLPSLFVYAHLKLQVDHFYWPFLAFVMVFFSAYRLAIFNIDQSQSDSFKGLPTPGNALFITGLPFLFPFLSETLLRPVELSLITLIFSFLLVSPFRLLALKFKSYSWGENKYRFTFLGFSVLLLVAFQWAAISLIIMMYLIFSLGKRKGIQ